MTSTTFERLRAILIRDYRGVPAGLTPETALDELGIDSLGTVELLWTLEEEFKIKLPTEPPLAMRTVGDVVGYIDEIALRGAAAVTEESTPGPAATGPAA